MSKFRRPSPDAEHSNPRKSAYAEALGMLARRELSEAQLRQRLTRKGHVEDEIVPALERLKSQGALDDERVAGAIARTEIRLRKRGRLRVRQAIEAAGIASNLAARAVEEAFAEVDGDELLRSALAKRLPGDRAIADDREFQRLYRHLVGKGFEPDRVLKTLLAKRKPTA